jgi:membrane protein required for colicin V production
VNFIDILILIPIIYGAYKGFKNGLIIEVFTLLALVVGLYAGIHFSDAVSKWLKDTFGWTSQYLPVISFTVTFLAIGAMVYFAGKAIENVVKAINLTPLNKFFGLFFAALKMTYFVSIGIVLIESYDEKSHFFPAEKKESSLLYNPFKKISTTTIPGISESSIFIQNTFKEESDSTGLTVEDIIEAKEIADSLGLDLNDAKEIKSIHDKYTK